MAIFVPSDIQLYILSFQYLAVIRASGDTFLNRLPKSILIAENAIEGLAHFLNTLLIRVTQGQDTFFPFQERSRLVPIPNPINRLLLIYTMHSTNNREILFLLIFLLSQDGKIVFNIHNY